jgi:hypothetical protein
MASISQQLMGRKVIGFRSDNHIDPDLAVEVFVLESRSDAGDVPPAPAFDLLAERRAARLSSAGEGCRVPADTFRCFGGTTVAAGASSDRDPTVGSSS